MAVFHARDGLKTRWRVLSSHADTRHSGVKRSVDGRVKHKELATAHKNSWVPVVNQEQLQQPRGEKDHNSNSVVYPFRGGGGEEKRESQYSGSHDDTAVQQVDERSTQERGDSSRRIRIRVANDGTPQRRTWEYRYNELIEYQNIHGHCKVPRTQKYRGTAKHSPLGKWVANQRESYKRYLKGESSSLTETKVDMLNNLIGFTWRVEKSSPRSTESLQRRTWEYRYNELIEYQNIHGHCKVPRTLKGTPTHSPLGKWVANQRESYKKYLKGESSSLTDAKVDMLNNLIGFTWRVEKYMPRATQSTKSD